jgi:D-amino-acid dehydrogenase
VVTTSDVVVVGAGVVGLSTAFHLARGGAQVEVVDAGEAGSGASRTNAGWVVPSMSEPVPSPAALRTAARWLGRRDGPLKVGLEPSPAYLGFLARMLMASRPAAFARGLDATAALAADAIAAFDDLERAGVSFERHARGVVLLFLHERGIEPHLHDLRATERFGLPPARVLDPREVADLEPGVGPRVVGGIHCPGDQHVDPSSLVDGLVAQCRAAGVRFRTGAPVTEVVDAGDRVRLTAGGRRMEAGSLVIAAGVGSRDLAARLGTPIPVRAGKGYGFDYRQPPVPVRHAVYLTDHKVAVTPLDGGLRVSGTMEFGSEDGTVDSRRAAGIAGAMSAYFSPWAAQPPRPWSGLRPMSPDGLPLIGRLPTRAEVHVATGHAMLGVTLGPVTGSLLSSLILDGVRSPLLEPFEPARFRARLRARGRAPRPGR